MNRKILICLIVLFAVATAGVNAQRDFQTRGPKGLNPEVVKYLQENVFPVMKIQRNEFDKELSAKEKDRIAQIRIELKNMHELQIEKKKEMRMNDEKPTLEQRKEMRLTRNKMHDLMDEVEIMAENHDATISRIFDEIGGEIEQWKIDLKGIRDKNSPNSPEGMMMHRQDRGMGPAMGEGMGRGTECNHADRPDKDMGPAYGMRPGNEMPLQHLFTPEGFLLWNPEEPIPFEAAEGMNDRLQLNIFPNPAAQSVQISLMLNADSKVTINISDKEGNEVQQLKADQASKGIYTKTVDVSKLKDGLYFVKVKAGEESALERLIIKN
jgi:hypothetical protein